MEIGRQVWYNKADERVGRLCHLHAAVKAIEKQGAENADCQTDQVSDTSGCGSGEALERDDHDGGGDHDSDDTVKGDGIKTLKECIDSLCQTQHGDKGADTARKQNAHIQVSDAVHKGRI